MLIFYNVSSYKGLQIMKPINLPQDYPFWYLKNDPSPMLKSSIKTNVVIVGGGMAGLSAAQRFLEKGLDVVLLEKSFCGSGATGKSSGFITPASELSLNDLIAVYGEDNARKLWEFAASGVHFIENNIKKFSIECDYQKQDTLVVSNGNRAFKNEIEPEHESRLLLKYASTLYNKENLSSVLASDKYTGGILYSDSFGIQGYNYCQEMKSALINCGVKIYEESPITNIRSNGVDTAHGAVDADHIVLCMDRFAPNLDKLTSEVYHAQTFLMLSSRLTEEEIKAVFPNRRLMVWDTDLIYQYYRVNGDNRLMLGGSSLLYTYSRNEKHNSNLMFNKLTHYFKNKFPQLTITFEYMWPGLIGIAKDIMPVVGQDQHNSQLYYACAGAGLPWSAAIGNYAAEAIVDKRDDLNNYFSPYRRFAIGKIPQFFMGTKAAFALSNIMRIKRWV